MKRSSVMKLFDASLFREIKRNLDPHRKVYLVEARLLLKQNNENICLKPKSSNFRYFLKLAEESLEREEYNQACIEINESLELLKKSSVSSVNLEKARICELAGRIYIRNYKIQESIHLLQRSLKIISEVLGEDCIYSSLVIFELTYAYYRNKRAEETLHYCKEFLHLTNKQQEFISGRKLKIMMMGHEAYFWQMGPTKALEYLKQCLKLEKRHLRKCKEIRFEMLWRVAYFYSETQETDKTKKYYKKCFNMLAKSSFYREIPKERAWMFIMDYYYILGMYDLSLEIAKKRLKRLKQSSKVDFLIIAHQYRYIVQNYNIMGHTTKYIYYYEKYLTIFEKIAGPKYPQFLIDSLGYCQVLLTKGLYRQSLKRLKKLKKELKAIILSNSNLKANYKMMKGKIYLSLFIAEKSLKKLNEAKFIYFEQFGENHRASILCCHVIGLNLKFQKYFDEALLILQNVFEQYQRIYSYFHKNCAIILSEIAHLYKNTDEFALSLQYYKRCLHIFKKIGYHNSYQTKYTYLEIAQLFANLGNDQIFFYYYEKSLNLEIESDLGKHLYYNLLYQIIAEYYAFHENYPAAKMIFIKYWKYYLKSETYSPYQEIMIIGFIAKMEYLQFDCKMDASKLNEYFKYCMSLYNELVEKGEIGQRNELAETLYWIKAYFYYSIGKYKDCSSTVRTILNFRRSYYKMTDYELYEAYCFIVKTLYKEGKFLETIQYSEKMLKLNIRLPNDLNKVSLIYKQIEFCCNNLGDFNGALKYSKKKLKIKEKMLNKSDLELKKDYGQIGIYLFRLNQIDRALTYFKIALPNAESSANMKVRDTCILNSIGLCYALKYQLYEALIVFMSCVENAINSKFSTSIVKTFMKNAEETEEQIRKTMVNAFEGDEYAYQIPQGAAALTLIMTD